MKITADFDYLHTGEKGSRRLTLTKSDRFYNTDIRLAFYTPMGRVFITNPLFFVKDVCEFAIPEGLLDGRGKLLVQMTSSIGDQFLAKSQVYEFSVLASVDDLTATEMSIYNLKGLAEISAELERKSDRGHEHDGRYYTEDEINTLLSGKSDSIHLHDGKYLTREEITDLIESVSADSHNHDGRYYTEAETDTFLSGKSDTSHTHDSRYYTESEVNTLLGKKSDSTHSHTYSELSGKPTIDGKEISGDITTDGLMYKRLLTSSDDLDDIFEDGVYVYSTSSLPKNAPFKNAAVIEVFGAKSTTTQKIQRAYRYGEAGHSAFRPLYAGAWGEWTVAPTEYVTENGQSGGLYYKKWKSGAAEIWGKVTYTASSAVAAGGEYEFDIALPFACTDICAFIHANTRVFKVRKAYPLTVTGTKVTVYTKLESSEALSEGATIDYILNIRCKQA